MSEKEVKKCPKCGGEMDVGFLPGSPWWGRGESLWSFESPTRIFAYRCKKCGYVEFYARK